MCGHACDICCLEHQDIKTSNIRQIENTTNIFLRSKYFFWRTPAKHRAVAKCVADVLGWISSGKMSLATINSFLSDCIFTLNKLMLMNLED